MTCVLTGCPVLCLIQKTVQTDPLVKVSVWMGMTRLSLARWIYVNTLVFMTTQNHWLFSTLISTGLSSMFKFYNMYNSKLIQKVRKNDGTLSWIIWSLLHQPDYLQVFGFHGNTLQIHFNTSIVMNNPKRSSSKWVCTASLFFKNILRAAFLNGSIQSPNINLKGIKTTKTTQTTGHLYRKSLRLITFFYNASTSSNQTLFLAMSFC